MRQIIIEVSIALAAFTAFTAAASEFTVSQQSVYANVYPIVSGASK